MKRIASILLLALLAGTAHAGYRIVKWEDVSISYFKQEAGQPPVSDSASVNTLTSSEQEQEAFQQVRFAREDASGVVGAGTTYYESESRTTHFKLVWDAEPGQPNPPSSKKRVLIRSYACGTGADAYYPNPHDLSTFVSHAQVTLSATNGFGAQAYSFNSLNIPL